MARLTRVQARARTRATLLEVATEQFLQHGYGQTSLEQIAEDAGYSKGAVYSNFGGKDELCEHVIAGIRSQRLNDAVALLDDVTSTSSLEAAIRRWCEYAIGDRHWALLEMEYAARGRTNDAIAEEVRASNQGLRDGTAAILKAMADKLNTTIVGDLEQTASLIVGLCLGVGIQRAFDHTVSIDAVVTTILAAMAG